MWAIAAFSGLAQTHAVPHRTATAGQSARLGQRFYEHGTSLTGTDVAATVQGDLRVRSRDLPCMNCHRRSAWGTSEGPVTVPPVTGSVLFAPLTQGAPQLGIPRSSGAGTRPAYTDALLLRALREGVDPANRRLSPTMPRYDVSEADAAALAAYLRSLSDQTPPGVTDSSVHLATIVTPRVSAARRASMLDVLRTYVRFKNAGTRYESRRRERGPWDMKPHYENYRDWVLHEWELHGDPKEWPAQLETFYRREPVFAVVSGIADEDWSPIDAFCARHGIPAVLPQTPAPPPVPSVGDGFYSLYFSKGVTIEAQTLGHHLSAPLSDARVLQVSRCGGAAEAAAAALAGAAAGTRLRSKCLEPAIALTGAVWHNLVEDANTLVLWLDASDMPGVAALAADAGSLRGIDQLYLSSTLLGEEALHLPAALAGRATLMHPFVSPDLFDRHAARSLVWMKANGITPADRMVAINALFAATLAADALNLPRTLGSREYFIERIEHMASRTPMPTAYPSVTFDPKRRFASAGCYLLKPPSSPGEPFRKVQEWYVPKL